MEQAKASNYLAVFFGGVMLGRLVLSPLVDRLGILKSMGVFGSLSAVLYIAGVVGCLLYTSRRERRNRRFSKRLRHLFHNLTGMHRDG